MAFAYYRRLSPRDRAIYRRSAAIRSLELRPKGGPDELPPLVDALARALDSGCRSRVQTSAARLLAAVAAGLDTSGVDRLRVLDLRPSDAVSELHGLYERDEDGRSQITVWMRTAAQARVVAFRTFMRTLLHELCHHLDYELLGLADSFHTEGFFARESSLMRQLAPRRKQQAAVQLELGWGR